MNIDDFRKLKNARHKLENVIQKNEFAAEIENELKEIQCFLNSIHSNYSKIEQGDNTCLP